MNRLNFDPLPIQRPPASGFWLGFISLLVGLTLLCANDMARGEALDETTRERLLLCAARISVLQDEVRA